MKKLLGIGSLIILAFAATGAYAVGAASPHALARLLDPPPPDPWTQMAKGVNLQYVYGDYNWQLLYPGPSPYVAGTNPYSPTRMANMYVEADFEAIADMGFRHVRFTIDPWALGLHESPGGAGDPMFTVPSSNAAVSALKADISLAEEHGLLSIVDFHSTALAQGQFNIFYNSRREDFEPDLPWISYNGVPPTSGSLNYNYLGTWKWHFLTTDENSEGQYPLEEFWASFAPMFNDLDFPIAFEILNEPFDGCYDQKEYDGGDPDIPGGDDVIIYALDGAAGFSRSATSPSEAWAGPKRLNWREIQLRCIKAIEEELPETDAPQRLILVGNAVSSPIAFRDSAIAAYTEEDEIDYPENIGYVCHFYDPYDFTHKASTGLTYDNLRDFYNKASVSTPYPVPGQAPMSNKFAYVTQWVERTKSNLAERGLTQPIHLAFTEFGCMRPDRSSIFTGTGPIQPGLGFRAPGEVLTPPTADPREPYPVGLDSDQARWVYDARREMEAYQAGWTYYGMFGSYAYVDGYLDTTWGTHGNWGAIYTPYQLALFHNE